MHLFRFIIYFRIRCHVFPRIIKRYIYTYVRTHTTQGDYGRAWKISSVYKNRLRNAHRNSKRHNLLDFFFHWINVPAPLIRRPLRHCFRCLVHQHIVKSIPEKHSRKIWYIKYFKRAPDEMVYSQNTSIHNDKTTGRYMHRDRTEREKKTWLHAASKESEVMQA